MNWLADIVRDYWKAGFEILLLAAVIYYFLLLFRGTRGAAVLTGFIIVLLGVTAVTDFFHLDVINWILSRFLAFLTLAVLVIFQPELRRALAEVGSRQFFGNPQERQALIGMLAEAARSLSQKRCGALVAIEREIGFRGVIETGVAIGAQATPELLTTIFFPNTPLHDGGVVLRGDTVVAAACIFPLSTRPGLNMDLGMRHRAALGLTEETDAVVIVVSEERGEISVAQRGQLAQGLDPDGLRAYLTTTLQPGERGGHWLINRVRRLLLSLRVADTPAAPPGEAGPPDRPGENG